MRHRLGGEQVGKKAGGTVRLSGTLILGPVSHRSMSILPISSTQVHHVTKQGQSYTVLCPPRLDPGNLTTMKKG